MLVRVIGALLFVPLYLSAQTDPTPTFANVIVHDPSVVRSEDAFYVFGSHLASASTTDLLHWTQLSSSPTAGNTLVPNPTVEFSEAITWVAGSHGFWAPDVIQLGDGRYYFYYCIGRLDQPRAALGLAVSNTITGPYTHIGIMLRSGLGGQPPEAGPAYDATIHPNTIDPAVFYDQTGELWMVYGSYSGGIFIVELDLATGLPKPGQGYGKHLIGGNHARIEGAYIIYSPESEYYYLFVSFGGLAADGGYNIRLGRSRNPDGPYLDAASTDLAAVKGAPGTLFDDASIAPHGVKLMGGYQFLHAVGEPGTTSRGYVSPGHNSAYYDSATGKYLLFFHTRFLGSGEVHEVRVHQMFVNADDWLVVAPHRYAEETIAPADPAQIPGTYKLIDHGKAISSTVATSTTITLHVDGLITGASTGTWQLSAEYDATLNLAGTLCRGVFIRQWDDDSQRWVLAFSTLSSNGVAVWGSKLAIDAAPVIISQPTSQTAMEGTGVTFTVGVTGDPAPTYQWKKDGMDISGETERTLAISATRASDAGSYTAVITNRAGTVVSSPATFVVNELPDISVHPISVTQSAGSSAHFSVTASGTGALSYQWFKNGAALAGEMNSTLNFASLQGADAGEYTVRVADSNSSAMSRFARLVVAPPSPGRIANMSVRSVAGRYGSPLIVGFVVVGGGKQMLVRGIGPTLEDFDVPGFMTDPALEVHTKINGVDTIVISNNDWADGGQAATLSAAFAQVSAFPLPDPTSKDAALLAVVDGSRTVHANGFGDSQSGVVLVETYDMEAGITPRLVNVSARNFAGRDAETLIAGFIIDGNVPRRVLVRGVGPTLEDFNVPGVLGDPRLEVHTTINDADFLVATNDDWADEPGVAAAAATAFAFPLRNASTDAALVLTLPAGPYTALVSGANSTTGEALVEVYELP